MEGADVLWAPGTDHAGIATQTVVEKRLQREKGVTRHDIGREKFVEEVFQWKDQYRDRIVSQLRRLGSSLDWSRERFTMDEGYSEAVVESFCRLYDDGLIFRDNRIVNWCCALQSTISDLEVEHRDLSGQTKIRVPGYERMVQFGEMVHFAYPVEGKERFLEVATTRIETMLGDAAVAVHPDDPRYGDLIGEHVIHPLNGRRIPIVADAELVDMEVGTGAVKVTPGHDPNDFLCGKRHNLPVENLLEVDGTLTEAAGAEFAGMRRYDARYTVMEKLKEKGLLREVKSHPMSLGVCSRTGDIVEPVVRPQWWVDCSSMAAVAQKAVADGQLELIPPQPHTAVWNQFLNNIQSWCVSRQLWWGHRIPAYRVTDSKEEEMGWVVARSIEDAEEKAREKYGESLRLEQDEDVLDTWFSSAIFPIAVHGWPKETAALEKFYPASVLETGMDILFFWVMRMVMVCGHLTGQLPFSQVFLHGIVRDAHGRKMSKSLGNVVDPIDVIEGISLKELQAKLEEGNLSEAEMKKAKKGQAIDFPKGIAECGTDALRFALCNYSLKGTHETISLDINVVLSHRHFCNKLWNATKFALTHLPEGEFSPQEVSATLGGESPMDRWVLHRLSVTTAAAQAAWQKYDFTECTRVVQAFWLEDLCATYMESVKPLLYLTGEGEEEGKRVAAARNTLYNCFEEGIRLLHPFMPYITEELWQTLPKRPAAPESVTQAAYPSPTESWVDEELNKKAEVAWEVVDHVRSMRGRYKMAHKVNPRLFLVTSAREAVEQFEDGILALTKASGCEYQTPGDVSVPVTCATAVISDDLKVLMELKGVDIEAEIKRQLETAAKAQQTLTALEAAMARPAYAKVAAAKVEKDTAKVATLRAVVKEHQEAAAGLQ